jgi:SAM-dependent methyltransferase
MNRLIAVLRSLGLLHGALRLLRRAGLLKFSFRAYQHAIARKSSGQDAEGVESANGLPLPPAELMVLVAGSADTGWFLQFGSSMFQIIVDALRREGVAAENLSSILEFGCGCGRVLRHWHPVNGPRVYGVDYNQRLVGWCRENLPFADYAVNALYPPLPYDNNMFDCIYAISVFTHLSAELQDLWMKELGRVIRPGGHLLITTHGETFRERLSAQEREDFAAGRLVVRYGEASGMNLCTAYHPESYIRGPFSSGFSVQHFIPAETHSVLHQDLYLLRRTLEEESASATV